MNTQTKNLRRQLRELRAEMRSLGIRKTSPFNGGMDRETQRWNERRFDLESKLESALRKIAMTIEAQLDS
jgi:hypothetical protein